jgi:GPI-anchor transamidase subunit T
MPYHSDDTCFPTDFGNQEWSLHQVFGKPLRGTCPLTDPDILPVCIQVPNSRSVYTSEAVHEVKDANGMARCFKLAADRDLR